MGIYGFIIQNKEVFKLFYALIVVSICVIIVFKTHKLFKLSSYNGLRYFRNSFFFFGLGFASRYFLKFVLYPLGYTSYNYLPLLFFEFFVIMAGFFLLYSLIWKKLESYQKSYKSSLFNPGLFIFYILALIIVILDYSWDMANLMYFSQIAVFFIASIISLVNSISQKKQKHHFQKFYFLAMFLVFIAWILNTLASSYFQNNQIVWINIYILNMVFFLIFLYGVIKVTKG